jgi:cell fate regulator YaaT (PSP1 superfamily)
MNKTDQSTPSGKPDYEIIHVRFADLPKTYNYNRNQLNVRNGEVVVAETDRGDGVGTVVIDAVEPCCNAPLDSLKRVLRKATEKDIERERERKELERRAYQLCVERASGFKLDMNLVTVQYFFDRSKAIFYFTADGRIDFRELVKSLAKSLNTRIEMRQIGVRDKARLVGGIGCCGRELCCQSFLQDFEPVSVRMAKDQNLPLNPSKISGVCGRLMCCLTFEHAMYKKMSKALPKCGKKVRVGSERGKVTRQNPMEGTVLVELEGGKEVEVGLNEVKNDSNG